MSFYFNKKAMDPKTSSGLIVANQFAELHEYRAAGHDAVKTLHEIANTGRTPADAYLDFENKSVLEPKEMGQHALLSKLMMVSRPVRLGKQVYEYRKASRSGNAKVSIAGRKNITIDHAEFGEDGTCLLIHDDAFGRTWLEQKANATEMFDALVEDAENSERVILESIDNYLFDGYNLSVKGRKWLGLRGDPSVVQAVLGVDLATETDAEVIRNEVKRIRDILLGDENNCVAELTLGISYEILSRWEDMVNTANGSNITILEYVNKLSGIKEIVQDSALKGNQITMLYINQQGVHPVTAMPISTYALKRENFNDDYVFIKWAMIAFVAKQSFSGQKTALYAE